MTTLLTPWGYAITLGVSSVQILPQNPSRKALIFFNPSANTVSICPSQTAGGAVLMATLNGAGMITLISGGTLALPQAGWPDLGIGSAFQGVASGAGTAFTVWEF